MNSIIDQAKDNEDFKLIYNFGLIYNYIIGVDPYYSEMQECISAVIMYYPKEKHWESLLEYRPFGIKIEEEK